VIADHGQHLSADPANRLNDPALGGGALLDLGIYPVSFAHDLLGAPTRVQASATMTATGVDRQNAMLFDYADGRQAMLQSALDAHGPNRACVIGTAGRIEIDSVWYMPTAFTVYAGEQVLERYEHPVAGRGMQFQAAELERLVAAGPSDSDLLPPRESVQIIRTLDEIRRQIGLRYPSDAAAGPV
jgi:predicted dehydrogenase